MHRTLKAAVFQRNLLNTFFASQPGDLVFKCQVQPPRLWRTFPVRSDRLGATTSPQRTPPPEVARSTRRPAAPGLPQPSRLPAAQRSTAKFLCSTRRPRLGVRERTATAASRRPWPAQAGPPLPSLGRPAAHVPHLGPRSPLLLLLLLPAPTPRGAGRAPVTCRAPGGLLLPPRHAARPPQPSPQPPPEFAGRGDAGPRARAQLRGAPNFSLVPAGSGLRARRGPRGAARMDRRARGRSGGGGGGRAGRVPAAGLRAERAGPGRRARSHPRRGPRAQRRALGGPARGPRSMLPPPRRRAAAGRALLRARRSGRSPAPSSASRESPSATFSPPRFSLFGGRGECF